MTICAISLYDVLDHALQVAGIDALISRAVPGNLHTGTFRHAAGDFVIEMRPAPGVPADFVIIRLAGDEVFRATIKRERTINYGPESVLAIWGSHQHWRAAFVSLPISGG